MLRVIFYLFIIAALAGASVLWEWEMTELPSGWTANSFWEFDGTGAHSFVSSSGGAEAGRGYYVSEMRSDTLTVPAGTDYLSVSLETDWDWDGWWASGESNCNIWLTVNPVTGGYYTVVFDSHSWGFDVPLGSCDDGTTVIVPLSSGDEFYLKFRSGAGSTWSAYAEMAWDVSDVMITDQNGVALERTTWGEIKSLF